MTFLSSLKLDFPNIKTKVIALSVLSATTCFSSSNALANSCSKTDIDYYLQRGFTNAQVVQLCSGPAGVQSTAQSYQAQTQQNQQNNQLREDQSYLSAALDADSVTMSSQGLTLLPRECIEYGPSSSRASADMVETICVNTKLKIDFVGMKINKASKGFFLVKDATVNVKGKIQREFIGISALRRQDREAILENLSATPDKIVLKIRRGIDPSTVANRLSKYAK
ncbi:MAG: hypothetical protein ACI88H_001315 [Cocleimonas sp.]|jgi:uncharacterized protein YajQ (UPF0234 family)